MFRALVCDTDKKEYDRIRTLIERERSVTSDVLFCKDGIEAFEIISKKQPDVVFTDISLPGMDGIELIRRCRENDITVSFVIMSRFRRFDYIKSLIKYGIEDYLVKPVPDEELGAVITDLAERSAAKQAQDENERLFRTRRSLRNAFMEAFLASPEIELDMDLLNEKYHFSLRPGLFRMAVVKLWDLPENEYGVFLPAVVQNARAHFDPLCHEMIPYTIGHDKMLLLFNYDRESKVPESFRDILYSIRDHLRKAECEDVTFSIGLGNTVIDTRDLGIAYESAENAAACSLFRGTDQFFDYPTMVFTPRSDADKTIETAKAAFYTAAELLDTEKLKSALRSAFSEMTPSTDPYIVNVITRSAVDAIKAAGTSDGAAFFTASDEKELVRGISMARKLSNIEEILGSAAENVFEQCRFERRNSGPVRKAMKYIDEHYSEPLTLDYISGLVHLNASYFSIVFKKQTGRNFSDYLTSTRVEAAKKLLCDSDKSVADICEAVGYLDRKYFSRIFEKIVGIKPSAYRALHS